MADREKVIKGLEWCMNEKHDCYREKGCPYENEYEDIGCKYALHRDALALLKAQEPVKPIVDVDEWRCGNCGHKLEHQELLGENVLFHEQYSYCPQCGRAVKWE